MHFVMIVILSTTDPELYFLHTAPQNDLSLSPEGAQLSRLMGLILLPRYAGTGQGQEERLHARGYGPRLFQK